MCRHSLWLTHAQPEEDVEEGTDGGPHPSTEGEVLKASAHGRPDGGTDEEVAAQTPPQGPGPLPPS